MGADQPERSDTVPRKLDPRYLPPSSPLPSPAAPPLPDRPRPIVKPLSPVSEHLSPWHADEPGVSQARPSYRPGALPHSTTGLRVVTPEPTEPEPDLFDPAAISRMLPARSFGSLSTQSSPRSVPGTTLSPDLGTEFSPGSGTPGSSRRQGVVFNDAFAGSYESASASSATKSISFRPRTHTMDSALRQQAPIMVETRQRVGSFSSSPFTSQDDSRLKPLQLPFADASKSPELLPTAPFVSSARDKKPTMSASSSRSRLIKRPPSRPTSPLVSPPPSNDSLPFPIPIDDANRILLLMKTLCGKMRGDVESQTDPTGPWQSGLCYIEDVRGSLMLDVGDGSSLHLTLVSDLRGCRVLPLERPDGLGQCLEIAIPHSGAEILLIPRIAQELDLWLAALLCWQQLRPSSGSKAPPGRPISNTSPSRPEATRQASSSSASRDATIIKVGKVMLWDKGTATSPGAIIKRPSTRDLRTPQTSWRRVSCILQDNGEVKLVTETDIAVLSIIELPQLARAAIQQLDRSVLDEDFCIGIFPIYASTSTQLSIFRPIYVALDSRVLFEVWFVLLRAFTVPEFYGLDGPGGNQVYEVSDMQTEPDGEVFRMEKTVTIKVTEAKLRHSSESTPRDRDNQVDHDLIGNYLAEIILDGEVRARTTTKTGTKSPFWREECEFNDLPSPLPCLSVVLKRVDGNLESLGHQVQASLGLPKTGNLVEVACGAVDINLQQMQRGLDHEHWLPVYDSRQQTIGTMLVKVHHEEMVVLLSSQYQPLSELLHRFSTGLTAQLTDALPGQLRRLAEVLLNIFQVSGKATEWLMNLVEDEIDGIGNQATLRKPRFSRRLKSNESIESASDREQLVRDMGKSLQGEANLLFRGNSLLTQALEFYMRRLGKEYLADVLAGKIFEINEINPNCEVDPGKLQSGEDIQQHWAQLVHLTTEVWECIATSAQRLPQDLRHILKYIRAVAEDRYGDFLRTVTHTSVSGFLFLRFVCPAILNPKLFGLLRDHPRPRAQRTLTLIAKGLQALANLSTIGKKETWMEPMNRFLNTNRQSLKDFLDEVCYVSVERINVSLPASYSTPITILGRMSPIEREGFPSLPYLIDHARSFAALVKLWVERSHRSNGDTRPFEGELFQFNAMCVELQRRADECYARVEMARAVEGASQLTADDQISLVDAMDQVYLVDSLNPSIYNSSTIHSEPDGRPPGSSGSEMEGSTTAWGSYHGRPAREYNSLRQASGSSDISGSGGTIRSLRSGKNARKFLSGFMRRNRPSSPDITSFPATVKDWDRQQKERDKNHDRHLDRLGEKD